MSSGSFGQKNAQSSSVKQSPSLNAKEKEEIGNLKKTCEEERKKKERKKKVGTRSRRGLKAYGDLIMYETILIYIHNSRYRKYLQQR